MHVSCYILPAACKYLLFIYMLLVLSYLYHNHCFHAFLFLSTPRYASMNTIYSALCAPHISMPQLLLIAAVATIFVCV